MVSPIHRRSVRPTARNARFLSKGWWRKILRKSDTSPSSEDIETRRCCPSPTSYARFRRYDTIEKPATVDLNEDLIYFSSEPVKTKCREIGCGDYFMSDLALYQHCRLDHSENFLLTSCCGRYYYTIGTIAVHIRLHHDGQHLCIRCREFFETDLLGHHLAKHGVQKGVERFYCALCGEHFDTEGAGLGHMKFHEDEGVVSLTHFLVPLPVSTQSSSDDGSDLGSASRTDIQQISLIPCFATANITAELISKLWNY